MALSSLRLRRALSLSSSLTKYHTPLPSSHAISASPSLSSATVAPQNPSLDLIHRHHLPFQSRLFRSSSALLYSGRFRGNNNNDDDIGHDTILFEGCDYNHWLITMDFPKDPAPTREEMIETYLQTLAKVVGSYEEAKKKMYAFSTTTYQGFQCLMTEEMSEKFKGLPGVVFVLPDSYIDPVNKEYGGDKYENGVITPRPPPFVQNPRPRKYGDQNRGDFRPNRPRQPMPNQQGNSPYGIQPPPMYRDTRNFGPQQNVPMQPNYSPAGAGDRRDPMPVNNAPPGRDPMPSYQAPPYNQSGQGYYNPQGGIIPPEQRDYPRDIRGDNRNYGPPQSVNYGPGAGGNYGQGAGGNYGQGAGASYGQGAAGSYGQGAAGNYGQGAVGNYGQGAGGNYGRGDGAVHRQETGYPGQTYSGHGEEQRLSQVEQRNNMQEEQRTYAPMAQTGQTK